MVPANRTQQPQPLLHPVCRGFFDRYGLRIVSVALTRLLPSVAVIVTGFLPPPNRPVRVLIANVAEFAPSGTMTLAGTVALPVSLLLSATETPPAGAAPFNVTVPIELAGAVTVFGSTVRPARVVPSGIVIVAVALFENADWFPAASMAATT